MNNEEIIDTVNLLEELWVEGLFYQFSCEMKELYDTKKECFIQSVMVIFKQRIKT